MNNFVLVCRSGENFGQDKNLSSNTKTLFFNKHSLSVSYDTHVQTIENTSYWLFFSGQILFPNNLISQLGQTYNPNNQAENILSLYQTMQEKAYAQLKGAWSIIIVDKKRGLLSAAGDQFGHHQLYYFADKHTFAIASTPQAIYQKVIESQNLDILAIQDYLCWGNSSQNQHFYADIEMLTPSSFLTYNINSHTFVSDKYYILSFKACTAAYNEYEEPYFADNLRLHIIDSIKAAFADKEKAAIGLSGGLDSSAIACVAHRFCPDTQLTAFTMFNEEDGGETMWAEKIIQQTNIQWVKIPCNIEYIKQNIQKTIAAQGIPLLSLSTVAQYQVIECAYQAGFTEITDGQGADELFGGYAMFFLPFLRFLRSQWLIKDYLQELFHLYNANITWKTIFLWKMKEIAKKYYYTPIRLLKAINPITYQCIKPEVITTNCAIPKVVLNEYLYEQYTQTLPHITRWGAFSAASFGMECLMPFSYSIDLAEYAFQIPSTQKIHKGWNKYIMRKAMVGIINDEVLWRKGKMGFHIPEQQWYNQLETFFKTYIKQFHSDDIVDIAPIIQHWNTEYQKNIHFRRFVFRVYCYLLWKNNL